MRLRLLLQFVPAVPLVGCEWYLHDKRLHANQRCCLQRTVPARQSRPRQGTLRTTPRMLQQSQAHTSHHSSQASTSRIVRTPPQSSRVTPMMPELRALTAASATVSHAAAAVTHARHSTSSDDDVIVVNSHLPMAQLAVSDLRCLHVNDTRNFIIATRISSIGKRRNVRRATFFRWNWTLVKARAQTSIWINSQTRAKRRLTCL